MTDFEIAVNFTLQKEGGYHKDPLDPGGETNFGISKRYNPEVDIKNLTRAKAIEIYRRKYWQATGCDDLEFPMNVLYFECCVNPGVGHAQRFRTLAKNPHHFLLLRMAHYVERAAKSRIVRRDLYGLEKRSVDLVKLVFA
jgi:lysozyme family protein